jgi:tetratricopeptide (TPR) repeat protein
VFLSISAVFGQNEKALETYNRGLDLQTPGKLDETLAEYDKAIALQPKLAKQP